MMACESLNELATQKYFLIVEWIEKESDEIIQFGGTNHIIEFTQDSFFLERRYWTDALDPENSCVNGHTDYFKGTYELLEEQIHFNGQSTNAEFILMIPECNRDTVYETSSNYQQTIQDVFVLNPEQTIYNQIRLERVK